MKQTNQSRKAFIILRFIPFLVLILLIPLPGVQAQGRVKWVLVGSPQIEPAPPGKDFGRVRRGQKKINSVSATENSYSNIRMMVEPDGRVWDHIEFHFFYEAPPQTIDSEDRFRLKINGYIHFPEDRRFASADSCEIGFAKSESLRSIIDSKRIVLDYQNQAKTLWLNVPPSLPAEFVFYMRAFDGSVKGIWRYRVQGQEDTTGEFIVNVGNLSGTVEIWDPVGNAWTPIEAGDKIISSDRIRTGPNSHVRLIYSRKALDLRIGSNKSSTVNVGENSLLSIGQLNAEEREVPFRDLLPEQGWLINLRRGAIRIYHTYFEELFPGRIYPTYFEELFPGLSYGVREDLYAVVLGTDLTFSYEPDTNRLGCYINEGQVAITIIDTRRNVTLTAGQKLEGIPPGDLSRVQRLGRAEWDSLVAKHGLQKNGRKQTEINIPSLNATVTGVKFYEGGYDGVSKDKRNYKTRFQKSSSQYIFWELNLDFPVPGRRIDFDINATWYKPDGSVLARQTKPAHIESGWTNSYHFIGWGWRKPGNWQPGTYRVELAVSGQKVATGIFEIIE